MNRSGILIVAIACLGLGGCVTASSPPGETRPMPLSAVDTSWQRGRGFDLSEAKALIEICTALDYGVDVPPDPDSAAVAKPQKAAGWEEVYPVRESLPNNALPPPIGPYANAWKLYHKTGSDIYVIAI